MSTLTLNELPRAASAKVSETGLLIELSDGRTISVPIAWFPRLLHGTVAERQNWRFVADGEGIHWPDLDEDISVEGIVAGRRSSEGAKSFQKWLSRRLA